ncbi:MAG: Ig-like domain-containing protein [Prevotella sp.]|nr:Ig-like domain-containing protein [Prevotella sp.]
MKKLLSILMALMAFATANAQYEIYTKDGSMYFWEQQQLRVNESGPASAWTLQTSKPVLLSDIKEVVRGYTVMNITLNSTPFMYDSRLQLKVGETAEYTAKINPSYASIKDVTWASSNPAVASIKNGHLEALSEGSTVISVRANQGGYTVRSYVMVKGSNTVHVTGLSVDPTQMTLYVGDQGLITPIVTPQNATVKEVTWKSSAPNIATVQDGVVKALAVGTATITAKTVDGGIGKSNFKEASCKVTVVNQPVTPTSQLYFGVKYPGQSSFQPLTASTRALLGQRLTIRAFSDEGLTKPLTGTYSITKMGQGTLQHSATSSDLIVWGRMAYPEPATVHYASANGASTLDMSTLFDFGPAVVVATSTGVYLNGVKKNSRNTVRLMFNPASGVCELANISASKSQCYIDGTLAYTYPGRADAFCFDDRQNVFATVVVPNGNNFNACVYGNGTQMLMLMRNEAGVVMPSIWADGALIADNGLTTDGNLCTTTVNTTSTPNGTEWEAKGWDFGEVSEMCMSGYDSRYVQVGHYSMLSDGTPFSSIDWSTANTASTYVPQNTITELSFYADPVNEVSNARVWSDGTQALYTHYNTKVNEWVLSAMNSDFQESSFFTRSFDVTPRMFAQNMYGSWFTAGNQNGSFVVIDGEGNEYFRTSALSNATINDFVLATFLPESWY